MLKCYCKTKNTDKVCIKIYTTEALKSSIEIYNRIETGIFDEVFSLCKYWVVDSLACCIS